MKGDHCIQCTTLEAQQEIENLSQKGMLVIDMENQAVYRDGEEKTTLTGENYAATYPVLGG
jgi:hypothetical protein